MSVTLFAVPPEIQPVFDALAALLVAHPDLANVNSYATVDTNGKSYGITVIDKWGNQQTFTQRIQSGKVFLEPLSSSLGPGGTQQFVATTLDATGQPVPATVNWTLQAGAVGTVVAGLYTAPATVASSSADYVTAQDASGNSATASIQVHP